MITYIVSFTFKMMTPYCQQYSVVKTQAHLRLMKVIIDYTEQQFSLPKYQYCWLWVTGQATMITVGKLALV